MIKMMKRMFKKSINKGFTLIELLLSVALIGILVSFSAPVLQVFQNKNNLSVAAEAVANNLRRAQAFSQGVKEDDSWGVRVTDGDVVVFKGNDFASRDQSFDEIFEISSAIVFSDLQEVVFQEFSGEPNNSGTFVLTSLNGEAANVSINEKGMVDY